MMTSQADIYWSQSSIKLVLNPP